MNKSIASSLCILVLAPLFAAAQETGHSILDSVPTASIVSNPGAQFNASNDGSSVALKIGLNESAIPRSDTNAGMATYTTWSVGAEAPLAKSDTSRNLFSANGFENATTIGFTYTHFRTPWIPNSPDKQTRFSTLCKEMQEAAAAKEGKPPSDFDCTAKNFSDYAPKLKSDARRLHPGPAPGGWLWGAAAKYGRQDVEFYDATTLSKSEPTTHPWSAGLFIGVNPDWKNPSLFVLKIDRAKTVEDQTIGTRCLLTSSATPAACVNGPIGPPVESVGTVLSFEARTVFPSGIGVGLEAARAFNKHRSTVSIPVYVFSNGDGGYIGGVRFGWNSGDRKTTAGVFVGVPFSAFF